MITKICTSCKLEKPISEFPPGKNYKGGVRSQCLECKRAEWRNRYHNVPGIKEKHSKQSKDRKLARPREYWAYSTMSGHKSQGCTIELSRKELIDLANITDHCEICGEPMDWGLIGKQDHSLDNSPSLDRTDNEKVLRIENVQIVCSRCNVSKNSRTMDEFIAYCKMIAAKFN
jgi:5-methylcytosine-specific restriction endonuclease McrA